MTQENAMAFVALDSDELANVDGGGRKALVAIGVGLFVAGPFFAWGALIGYCS
jgi:lactobin A/cerein 7B family class IIb bacteriocin